MAEGFKIRTEAFPCYLGLDARMEGMMDLKAEDSVGAVCVHSLVWWTHLGAKHQVPIKADNDGC